MAAEEPVGWQSGPDRRGTSTIITSSLFTIIACTWSILHLNIPGLDDSGKATFLRKCKWAVITLLFPEFIMAHAILEFVLALESMKELDENGLLDDNPPWFFRYFRSLVPSSNDEETGRVKPPSISEHPEPQKIKWNLTHCYFANMGGFYIEDNTGSGSGSGPAKYRLLTTRHFIDCWREIDIPNLSEDDLNDKSKTDYFTKSIAVIQLSQLLLSLIVRKAKHLAFSQLETMTLAFAICGVLTYGCSWYKPQDVKRPIQVWPSRDSSVKSILSKAQQRSFDSLWHVVANSNPNGSNFAERIPNDNIPYSKAHHNRYYPLYVMAVLAAGFGSIHAIAWNFEFPSPTEQLLWRIATLLSTISLPVALVGIPLSQVIVSWGDVKNFRESCLAVMREYSYTIADNQKVRDAMAILQQICDSRETVQHRHFQDIFGNGDTPDQTLGKDLLEYIEKDKDFQACLPEAFLPKFRSLVGVLTDPTGLKRLWDAARTDSYPKRRIFGPRFNDGIIYISSIFYCISRLMIIGVSFSSLRQMPDSVYLVPWTNNIPNVQ